MERKKTNNQNSYVPQHYPKENAAETKGLLMRKIAKKIDINRETSNWLHTSCEKDSVLQMRTNVYGVPIVIEQAHNNQNDGKWSRDRPVLSDVLKHRQDGLSVMAWGSICSTPLIFVPKGLKISQDVYNNNILESVMLPFGPRNILTNIQPDSTLLKNQDWRKHGVEKTFQIWTTATDQSLRPEAVQSPIWVWSL